MNIFLHTIYTTYSNPYKIYGLLKYCSSDVLTNLPVFILNVEQTNFIIVKILIKILSVWPPTLHLLFNALTNYVYPHVDCMYVCSCCVLCVRRNLLNKMFEVYNLIKPRLYFFLAVERNWYWWVMSNGNVRTLWMYRICSNQEESLIQ